MYLGFSKVNILLRIELDHNSNRAKTNNNEQLHKQYQKEENDSIKVFKKTWELDVTISFLRYAILELKFICQNIGFWEKFFYYNSFYT